MLLNELEKLHERVEAQGEEHALELEDREDLRTELEDLRAELTRLRGLETRPAALEGQASRDRPGSAR